MRDLASKILSRQQSNADKTARKTDPTKPKITTGKVLKYMFLPDIGSRIRDIGKRFGNFAYFLAQIFYSCRLIPPGHPVLNPANIGYFGFSDVISTAAANLQLRKENTDQIVMFAGVIISMVLLIANGLAIAAYTVFDFGDALAQNAASGGGGGSSINAASGGGGGSAASGSMFVAPHPETDLALQFLDRVFGASNVPFFAATPGALDSSLGGTAIKEALYAMLSLYSTAMMVIAVIIVLYYAFTIVGESAMTGQPFGKRFNSFWAPIRLVIGLGLLVPLGGGLNAAQYTTLYAAKLGSGLASYAWTGFVKKLADTNLVAEPEYPQVAAIVASVVRFETCRAVTNKLNWINVSQKSASDGKGGLTFGWVNTSGRTWGEYLDTDFGIDTSTDRLIDKYSECGTIKIGGKITSNSDSTSNSKAILPTIDTTPLTTGYVEMLNKIITDVGPAIDAYVDNTGPVRDDPNVQPDNNEIDKLTAAINTALTNANIKNSSIVKGFADAYKTQYDKPIEANINKLDQYGWMGAGMFYNQIADLNGTLANVLRNSFPQVVGDIKERGLGNDSDANEAGEESEVDKALPRAMRDVSLAFENAENVVSGGSVVSGAMPKISTASSGDRGIIYWTLRFIGGGAFEAFRVENPVNPLASLVAVGKSFLDKATMVVGGVALSAVGSVASIAGSVVPNPAMKGVLTGVGGVASALGGLLIAVGVIGIVMGAFLYYILPLIPFLYFFAAVVSWILDVIEAMVGLPLWALAHIRIDGDGLSGQAGQFGYMAIFGIILRPFVILFGLIIGIILFSAAMMTMRQMFSFYVGSQDDGENTGVDFILFSAVYTMIAYTLAMLCFKQTDQMPKSIMRWFGTSETSYNDGQPDPAEGMKGAMFAAGAAAVNLGNQLNQSVSGMGSGVKGGVEAKAGEENRLKGIADADAAAAADRKWKADMLAAQQGGGGLGSAGPKSASDVIGNQAKENRFRKTDFSDDQE